MNSSSRPAPTVAAPDDGTFASPAVRAKYQPGGVYGHLMSRPVAEAEVGREGGERDWPAHPANAPLWAWCHGLIFGFPWPRPGERRQGWGREWACERFWNGQLIWRRIA